jgi:hypothetical protein
MYESRKSVVTAHGRGVTRGVADPLSQPRPILVLVTGRKARESLLLPNRPNWSHSGYCADH